MDKRVLRLIDANFNRAREALRVMEDYARFVLDNKHLSGGFKELRHQLRGCMGQLSENAQLLAARDTARDVGTTISTEAEGCRADAFAVVEAAGRRLSEALRCLEEYSKIDNPEVAASLEALRYKGYQLEKKLGQSACRGRFSGVQLYVLLTEEYCNGNILDVCQAALDGGADCIQLREKNKSDRELLALADEVCRLCKQAGALFFMNDRVDLAVLARADGVHLGQDDISVAEARQVAGDNMIVGKSSHNMDEALAAVAEEPDYLAFGAIFGSATKPSVDRCGVDRLREVSQVVTIPIVAIGGITAGNAGQAIESGATSVAVCQAVISADDVESAARELKSRFLDNLE
ncbi:MAG: thiamine phosphate synthase [Sedimentisphaerales bacterium]|nr:thiamine phosphate synthase [Sedimentisphaerales bacterium]